MEKNDFFAGCPSCIQGPQQTAPTDCKPLPSWVTYDPSPTCQAATTDQSGLVQDCEFSFSTWSLPSRNLHSYFDGQTKREMSRQTLLQRHILYTWHRLGRCLTLRRVGTAPFQSALAWSLYHGTRVHSGHVTQCWGPVFNTLQRT